MGKIVKFLFIGGAATLLQFFLLAIFVELNWLSETPASALSYALSAVFNYVANYYFTFASTHSHKQTFPKFVTTAILGVAINTALFKIALTFLENHALFDSDLLESAYLFAQLFATLVTLIVNFLLHKFWIYRR